MICLAAFRRSNFSISSLLCARNATPLLGGESRNATPFLGDYCHFSTIATSGQSNQKTSKKKVKQTTLLLYEKKKSNDFYIFWYRGFFIGFPLLLTCLGPYYVELVSVMYPDPGFFRYFCFIVPTLAAGALYKLIHAWGTRFPQKVEYTKDRTLNMQVIGWPGKMKQVTVNPGVYAVRNNSASELRLTEPSKVVSYGYVFDKKKGSLHNQKILNKLFQSFDPSKMRRHSLRNRL